MSKLHKPSFYAGILVALAVIARADERTLFDEIVKQVHVDALVKTARRDGQMGFSGLSKYGYGKRASDEAGK
jgi:hypothetical protein